MRVAIVGNGPSAANKGAEIDAHDFVVRCNAFRRIAAKGAGEKLSAWAWFGCLAVASHLGEPPAGDYQVWMTKALAQWGCSDVVDPRLLIRWAAGRLIRWVTEPFASEEAHFCGAAPSTGFAAVDMAIRMAGAREISLYGFDATTPEAPGWGDGGPDTIPWSPIDAHAFRCEKIRFTQLRDEHKWIDGEVPVRLNWRGPNQ